jgi:cysteine synthase
MDKGIFVNHGLEGLAVGVKPPIYRSDIVDFYIDCSEEAALAERKWLLRKHGIFSGKSSGANLHGIRVLSERLRERGESDTSVVISLIYDSGDSYI